MCCGEGEGQHVGEMREGKSCDIFGNTYLCFAGSTKLDTLFFLLHSVISLSIIFKSTM